MPPKCWMKSAFVNGLPSPVRGRRSSTRLETLTLREVIERSRAVLLDTRDEHLAAAVQPELASHTPNLHKLAEGFHLFQNKSKVHPVLEFRELNEYVDADTAHADVWGLKLREWRKKGSNVSVLNLRRAYLQVRVYKSLWPYQTVILEGKRYYLSHMGFGLNVALSFMRAIVEAILSKDDAVQHATSAYFDDVFINEDIASATRMRQHLTYFGLATKELDRLKNGARLLGLTFRE